MRKCKTCLLFDEEQRGYKNMGCTHPKLKTLLCPLTIKYTLTPETVSLTFKPVMQMYPEIGYWKFGVENVRFYNV